MKNTVILICAIASSSIASANRIPEKLSFDRCSSRIPSTQCTEELKFSLEMGFLTQEEFEYAKANKLLTIHSRSGKLLGACPCY